jgi:CTP:molybdopterin cytidylyltransferase MocA
MRFGVPKAVATLPDGRSFLAACAAMHSTAGLLASVATLPAGLTCPIPTGVVGVPLEEDGLAMFDSLRIALAAAGRLGGWLAAVIHPVDHPLVNAETVRALLAALLASPELEAVLPSYSGKHGHPIALRRTVCDRIVRRMELGPTLREVLYRCQRADVPVTDAGVTANCNTPERLVESWDAYGRDSTGAG